MLRAHPKILLLKLNPLKLIYFVFKKPNLSWLNKELNKYFPNKHFLFTKRGITAFEIIVKRYNLQNQIIALPAFICNTFYPILKTYNIKTYLIDSEKTGFNMSLNDLKEKLANHNNIKALIVCHTFGKKIDIAAIKKTFDRLIIEDLSHLPLDAGCQSNIAFMSLAKMFPVFNGGLLISNKPLKQKYSLNRFNLNVFSYFLKHFAENQKKRTVNGFTLKEKLQTLNIKLPSPPFTYFSVLLPKRNLVFALLKKQGIRTGRVWHKPLLFHYKEQIPACPNAISHSQQVLNLPIQPYFTEKHLNKIAESLKLALQKIRA